ncbi:cytochrome c oxidase assembly protein [Streptomyces montanisoli]|uniref:Cytochrome c oxidase assembly protein n=1 Tax=Streptomyces montanisoli TaxID=2798581 RepID=A0A940MHY7_9ACTN|nr:cytochrome c oxidase assembly protein [Streptomyces montanisoli]MBP0461417.1 cytochrome c oxidase assembly protein [Streptomyces montanisoli]
MLPELTVGRGFTSWTLDPAALVAVVLLGALYAAGVVRRLRSGGRWSVLRTALFAVVGLGMIVVATMSSLAVYDRVLFWPAAVQNILLDLLAPLGLALGDPLGLASPDGRLRRAVASRPVRLLTFPLVSSLFVLVSELTIYFTPYFPTALHNDLVRQLMHAQLLLTGCLFVLPMLSKQEMLPRWCSYPVRALLVFVDGLFDSLPGLVVMTSGTLVAGDWYRAHPRTWGPTLQFDQTLGGGLMLTLAEIVALPFLIAVFFQWWHSERARTAELDARLDAELTPVPAPAPASTPASEAPAGAVPAAAPAAAAPERVRPWWETDGGEVGQRMRRGR